MEWSLASEKVLKIVGLDFIIRNTPSGPFYKKQVLVYLH